eukprot:jgi/Ulvmu1/12563/UM091_0004.1
MARQRRRRSQHVLAILLAIGIANACHAAVTASGLRSKVRANARSLQQAVNSLPPEDITEVVTAAELEKSIRSGARDIVIKKHLDLTDLPLQDNDVCEDGCDSPFPLIKSRSIRGNCTDDLSSPPAGVQLSAGLARTKGQCLLRAGSDMMQLGDTQIWMDNLFLKIAYPSIGVQDRSRQWPNLIAIPPASTQQGERYITRMTLEGDGQHPAGGLWADSDVLIEDSTFSLLGGPAAGIGTCPECRSALISKAHVTIDSCRFEEPLDLPGAISVLVAEGGKVLILRSSIPSEKDDVRIVKADPASEVYSDERRQYVNGSTGPPAPAVELQYIPRSPLPGERFLRSEDTWLTQVREILVFGVVPVGGTMDGGGGGGGGGSSTGIIVGVVVALLVAVTALAVLLVICHRRKRGAQQEPATAKPAGDVGPYANSALGGAPHSQHSQRSSLAGTQSAPDGSMRSHLSSPFPFHATGGSSVPSLHNSIHSSAGGGGYPTQQFSSMHAKSGTYEAQTMTETFDSAAPTSGPPPSVDAPTSTKIDYLHSQLSHFGKSDVLLGRFTLLGETQRRQGGQGVVAFATGMEDRLEYAIKFFVVHSSYIAERQLYESKLLGALLPKIEDVYDPVLSPSRLLDRCGRPLPPCIVMERGESLNEWSRRAKPDVFQSVAVMAHVATRLRDMHQAGYVHRDIKPSNIMLLPRENRWTVIDFGSTAEAGVVAPLSYTLVYAAPEIAEAGAAGLKTVVADPAIDAWALGVVAFELLTGASTFDMLHDGKASVIAQLRGKQELPWEGERFRSRPDLRKRLGVFKSPVLALLHRDPGRRASMADFCAACNNLFSGPATVQGV